MVRYGDWFWVWLPADFAQIISRPLNHVEKEKKNTSQCWVPISRVPWVYTPPSGIFSGGRRGGINSRDTAGRSYLRQITQLHLGSGARRRREKNRYFGAFPPWKHPQSVIFSAPAAGQKILELHHMGNPPPQSRVICFGWPVGHKFGSEVEGGYKLKGGGYKLKGHDWYCTESRLSIVCDDGSCLFGMFVQAKARNMKRASSLVIAVGIAHRRRWFFLYFLDRGKSVGYALMQCYFLFFSIHSRQTRATSKKSFNEAFAQ